METRGNINIRRHGVLLLLITLALFGTAVTVAADGGGNSVQLEQSSRAPTLVGTWRVEITLQNCQTGEQMGDPFPALATFALGGTVTTSDGGLSPAARGTGHGVWWRQGGRTFKAVTEAFLFSPTGTLTGTQHLAQEVELARDGRSFQAEVSATVTNPAGQFTGCATTIGQRLD